MYRRKSSKVRCAKWRNRAVVCRQRTLIEECPMISAALHVAISEFCSAFLSISRTVKVSCTTMQLMSVKRTTMTIQ